jgi:putative ABC transport system ATP-binding protein/lipoprotein-releasing system ATP-binding protein
MGIIATDIEKSFGDPPVDVLKGISLTINDGEFVALTGRSGSGKSTLMYILSSLDNPTKGKVEISGKDLATLSEEDLHQFRNEQLGFVFQSAYMIAELNAFENVMMPTRKFDQYLKRKPIAESLLEQFGLKDKLKSLPRQLSGGEQQRVAIARALVMEPKFLFADEPTGALDTLSGDNVMKIIINVNKAHKTTVLMVTHDPDFAKEASREIIMADGKIVVKA